MEIVLYLICSLLAYGLISLINYYELNYGSYFFMEVMPLERTQKLLFALVWPITIVVLLISACMSLLARIFLTK